MSEYFIKVINRIRGIIKYSLWKILFGKKISVGKKTFFYPGCHVMIENTGKLKVGSHCFFNRNCSITSLGEISIGDDCIFGENIKMYDHNHKINNLDVPFRQQGFDIGKIKIGNNVWIGSDTVILPNVKIGNNVVVAAGSIITKDIEDNIEDILEKLKYFVRNNFHVINHSCKESIYEILQEIVFDKREKTLSQEKFIEISEIISKINKVLPSIISNTKIELEQTNHTNMNNSVSFITFLCENGNRIPIEYASEGIKKLIPVLHYLIQVHNNPEECVVIDNIDKNIFGFALGEIILAINNNSKGQFIFTSNNSNVLTKLNSKHIICTTTNPKNRYIELHQTKSEAKENLEDFYIRTLMLGGQKEPLCNIYDFLGIDSAFLVSDINPAPNTEEEVLQLSENLQTFLSRVKFQEVVKNI